MTFYKVSIYEINLRERNLQFEHRRLPNKLNDSHTIFHFTRFHSEQNILLAYVNFEKS